MSEHYANITWARNDAEPFVDNQYSRGHTWLFDGGLNVPASSSPHVIPTPFSIEANVDPEEAFVAALSSCHMLWFLFLAANKHYVVDSYADNAVGTMGKNAEGRLVILDVVLKPQVQFSGENIPDAEQILELHESAHRRCFIANSVKTQVRVEPR